MNRTKVVLADLYEADQTAWQDAMAECIQRGAFDELDYSHLAEFLAEWAARDRREVVTRLTALIDLVMKWEHDHTLRARSWGLAILEQERHLKSMFHSPTLRTYAETNMDSAYSRAVKSVADELGMSENEFPARCPYKLAELLEFDVREGY